MIILPTIDLMAKEGANFFSKFDLTMEDFPMEGELEG